MGDIDKTGKDFGNNKKYFSAVLPKHKDAHNKVQSVTNYLYVNDVFGLLRETREMHQGDQEDAKL